MIRISLIEDKRGEHIEDYVQDLIQPLEFLVMSFILTNAQTTFMDLMNRVFKLFLGKFLIVFVDDILVYSNSPKNHEEPLRKALQRLKEQQLYASFLNASFSLIMTFLRHVIQKDKI